MRPRDRPPTWGGGSEPTPAAIPAVEPAGTGTPWAFAARWRPCRHARAVAAEPHLSEEQRTALTGFGGQAGQPPIGTIEQDRPHLLEGAVHLHVGTHEHAVSVLRLAFPRQGPPSPIVRAH